MTRSSSDERPHVVTAGRRALGAHGERLVSEWYERRGHVVLDRNWRCREGEIDLVVRVFDGSSSMLVVCEVKTRSSDAFGSPAAAVTPAKQGRLRRLAMRWLAEHPEERSSLRFDVASVVGRTVSVIEGAF